jgi:predicted dienelactone hydrolase
MIAALARFIVLCVLAADAAGAAVTVQTQTLLLRERPTQVDLYVPAAAPRGLAVVAHGFMRSRERHAVLARQLAQAGFLVAVPDLPRWSRPAEQAAVIVDLVDSVATQRGAQALPVVLIGTSAGGLATLLASERVPRLAVWVGLDPVDAWHRSRDAARQLQAPALLLRAPAAACNFGGSARRMAAWLPEGHVQRRIDGASHCDFEDPTDRRCEALCGPADAERQTLIVQLTVDAAVQAVQQAAAADAMAGVSARRP